MPALIAPIFCVFLNFAIAVEWRRSTCFCRSVFTSQPKDVIVLGLGISERPGIASAYLEREAHDRDSIDLPEAQKDLAKKIIALGKPTIIFLLNGGGPAFFFWFFLSMMGRSHRLEVRNSSFSWVFQVNKQVPFLDLTYPLPRSTKPFVKMIFLFPFGGTCQFLEGIDTCCWQ